jgi:hypothetical protein
MSNPVDSDAIEESFDSNLRRVGEIFVYTLWIQSQMADLVVFARAPGEIEGFVATPAEVPRSVMDLRLAHWEGDFQPLKSTFVDLFADLLTEQDRADLDFIAAYRNAIGHSHVSIGRGYFLYRPRTRSEGSALAALQLESPPDEASDPPVVKVDLSDDERYLTVFGVIKRLDEDCFERVAIKVGVPHSRIR